MNKNRVVRRKNEHQYVSERLSAYLDRQVSDRQVEQIKTHLETCEQCQQELETLLWTKRLLRQVPVVPVPRSFVVREADVEPARVAPRRRLFAMQWATAVVALLFVVVLFGDALTGGWMRPGSRQVMPGAMLAEPAAMEQKVAEAPKAVVVEQGVTLESEVAVEREIEAEKEVTIEQKAVIEKESVHKMGEGEVDGTPSGDDQVRAFALETESGEAKAGAANAVTSTMTSVPAPVQVEEAAPPAEPTLSLEAQLTAPPPPASGESEDVAVQADEPLPEPSLEPLPAPVWGGKGDSTRIILRGVEIGLGVALIGLIVAVVLLRRRT
ncbi:MAG: zf-HC2 domain-containing protein [Anaerolineae bacterium]|nr:zf-HC2 domain-containing protein [Anaerolineae bacterium]